MEDFKLQIFEDEHRGKSFPRFHSLQSGETEQIRRSLARKAGLEQQTTGFKLLEALSSKAHSTECANAGSEDFDLLVTIRSLGIHPLSEVYINWDDFVTIDRMRLGDLTRNFDYIWYPGPDDIEIFDDSLSWLLFIDHSGFLRVFEVPTTDERAGSSVAGDKKLF